MHLDLLKTSDLAAADLDEARYRRERAAATLHRLRRGRYLCSDTWAALDARSRHCALVQATLDSCRAPLVVSHESAGALWGFPVLDGWPDVVHVLDPSRRTGKRTARIARHAGDPGPTVLLDGLVCTAAARTAVDIALLRGFAAALMTFDFGLHEGLFTRDQLQAHLAERPRAPGRRGAAAAAELADAAVMSAGESLSRASMHERRIPQPELQKQFRGARGESFLVDFWWPHVGVIGEFDGRTKYLDPRMRGGRSVERVLLDEKARHDALAVLPEVRNIVRWDYATARRSGQLARVLAAAGVSGAA